MRKKIFVISITVFIILILCLGIGYYIFTQPRLNVSKNKTYLFIKEGYTIDDVHKELKDSNFITNDLSFNMASKVYQKKYSGVKRGAYAISPNMSIKNFLRKIYTGEQTPINLRINNVRLKKTLVKTICKQTDIDSTDLSDLLEDKDYLASKGFDRDNILTLFIPNTYEIYWTIGAKDLINRMEKEYKRFWNNERLEKAAKIPLSPIEVSILASIVDEESNKTDEKPIIAGLYINRLKSGQKLQADPTARYALGDFTIVQVYTSYTQIDSPYNTYIYKGLPPGPIRIPSIAGIDAVLNYAKHNYLFMCAKPELNGRHNFAASYSQHLKYASQYHKALKEWKAKKAGK